MPIDYESQRPKVEPPLVPLAAFRASHGHTQEYVAERVRAITNKTFTKAALCAIEKGHRGASPETLAALETVYRLPAGSFVLNYAPTHDRRKKAS